MTRVNLTLCPSLPALLLATSCSLLPAFLLTWRTSFLACGVNHPLLSLVCYQLPTLCYFSPPSPTLHNTPHRSSYNIYINYINNISRPRLTQYLINQFYARYCILGDAIKLKMLV
jgi:hypothetical protein